MSALSTIHIGYLYPAEAPTANRSQLELALRTEVSARRQLRTAMRTRTQHRLPQQEVNHRADSARHHNHDQHPQSSRHSTPPDIAAHITHQEHIAGKRSPPRIPH